MKKLLLVLLVTTTMTFVGNNSYSTEMLSSSAECTVTFTPIECYIQKAIECYQAMCPLESGSYKIFIIPWSYGGNGEGYTIHYLQNSGGIQILGRSYETKGEAISAWIKKVYGDCTYVYK